MTGHRTSRISALEAKLNIKMPEMTMDNNLMTHLNSALTTMLERCGTEMLHALLMSSTLDGNSTLEIIPRYVTGLFYNLSNLGYRLVQKVMKSCTALLAHEHLVQEMGVSHEMVQAWKDSCTEFNTDGDIGWYGFFRKNRLSYTEFARRIPILMAFVGRITQKSGSKSDQAW